MEPPRQCLNRNAGAGAIARWSEVDICLGFDSLFNKSRHSHEGIRRPDFRLDLLFQTGLFLNPLLHLGHLPLDLAFQGFPPEHGTQGHRPDGPVGIFFHEVGVMLRDFRIIGHELVEARINFRVDREATFGRTDSGGSGWSGNGGLIFFFDSHSCFWLVCRSLPDAGHVLFF